MDLIKRYLKKNKTLIAIYRYIRSAILTIIWNIRILYHKLMRIQIAYGCCFVFTTLFGLVKINNWGDDLNSHLFSMLSPQKICFIPFEKLYFCPNVERYSLIGSIIGDFNLDNTIIYGSGAITSNPDLKGIPKKVLSVRGPFTRNVLISKGIDCPPVYGDPALLLPLVYRPNVKARNKIGVIPHYRTEESDWIEALKSEQDVLMISMSGYEKWTDIIDSILSCRVILSESLHGLIVSEAYGIPSLWVEFAPHDKYSWEWDFKYLDFYRSIGKENPECCRVYEGYSTEAVLERAMGWRPGTIDYHSILSAFPFELKDGITR